MLRGHVLICLHVFEAFHHQKIPVGVLKIKYNLPKNFPFYIFSVILHIFVWFAFCRGAGARFCGIIWAWSVYKIRDKICCFLINSLVYGPSCSLIVIYDYLLILFFAGLSFLTKFCFNVDLESLTIFLSYKLLLLKSNLKLP